jgi:hypothetical protein
MRSLQKELDDLRETRTREREREARRVREDTEELRMLRDRCERLEEEQSNNRGGVRVFLSLGGVELTFWLPLGGSGNC